MTPAPDLQAISAHAERNARARDLPTPSLPRDRQPRSGLAVEPADRDWPTTWPTDIERIPRLLAVAAVHLHTELLKTKEDLALALLIAEHYPWPFMSRETMATELGTSVASVDERLAKLQRLGLVRSYPTPITREDWLAGDFGGKRSLRLLTIPELHWTEDMTDKKRCAHCGRFAPPGATARWTYCSPTCRVEAGRKRRKQAERAKLDPLRDGQHPTQTHEVPYSNARGQERELLARAVEDIEIPF